MRVYVDLKKNSKLSCQYFDTVDLYSLITFPICLKLNHIRIREILNCRQVSLTTIYINTY